MKREIQAVESGEDFIINVDIHRVWIIIVQNCAPCIILAVGIVRIMQNCFAQL